MTRRINYAYAAVADLTVETTTDSKSGKPVATSIIVNDEPIEPTERFWVSLFARFGFNKSFFRFFDYSEVFQRISEVESRDQMRLCIERNTATGESRLLAVSNPTKPVVCYDDLIQTLEKYEGERITYCDGIVESSHVPRVGASSFQIGGDEFSNRFILSTPTDGWGLPSIYLSLLRQVCSNGMVGYAKTFRSTLSLGRSDSDVNYSIVRALDGFSDGEGFSALRQRFDTATQSWASVHEAMSLYALLIKLLNRKHIITSTTPTRILFGNEDIQTPSGVQADLSEESGSPVITAFHQMTGDVCSTYGLANIDAMSVKRQRSLPVKCTTYDLLNFVSELGTHHADEHGSRAAQAWLGTLISSEYDLENSKDSFDEFQDFFLEQTPSPERSCRRRSCDI